MLLLDFIDAHESISSRNIGLPLMRLFDNFSSRLIDRYLAGENGIEEKYGQTLEKGFSNFFVDEPKFRKLVGHDP